MNTPRAAGVMLRASDGRVLFVRRGAGASDHKGEWAFPGGGIEEGEDDVQAARRELHEETGYSHKGKLFPLSRRPEFATHLGAVDLAFEPKLNEEHSTHAWRLPSDAPRPLHPGVQGVLDMAPRDWEGVLKFVAEEMGEPEHADDVRAADERQAFDLRSARSYDKDGHLRVARTPISKANICEYSGREIPGAEALGLDLNKKYRLLRDPEELKKAAETSNGKPALIDHVVTTADSHKGGKVVGSLGTDAEFEDPYLYNSLAIWPKEAIDGIEDGSRRQLSMAYRYRADMTPGTYKGEAYDGVMRDIHFNHVAVIPEGRVGSDVMVADAKPAKKFDFGFAKPVSFAFDAPTLASAKSEVSGIGMTIKKIDDEYCVNFRGGSESTAYYTNDLQDAVNTAKAMASRRR